MWNSNLIIWRKLGLSRHLLSRLWESLARWGSSANIGVRSTTSQETLHCRRSPKWSYHIGSWKSRLLPNQPTIPYSWCMQDQDRLGKSRKGFLRWLVLFSCDQKLQCIGLLNSKEPKRLQMLSISILSREELNRGQDTQHHCLLRIIVQ